MKYIARLKNWVWKLKFLYRYRDVLSDIGVQMIHLDEKDYLVLRFTSMGGGFKDMNKISVQEEHIDTYEGHLIRPPSLRMTPDLKVASITQATYGQWSKALYETVRPTIEKRD